MLSIPRLQSVPNLSVADLTYKISLNGALLLKQGRFMSRYTGNNKYRVDLNGNLLTNAEYKIAAGTGEPKKKKPVETGLLSKNFNYTEQISADLSTIPAEKTSDADNLSPKQQRTYKIHKKKVRERITLFINTRYGHYELYFWTITFPEGTADEICFRALDIWLTTQRNKKRLHEYLWVTERQKNGTVHFHITIPHKMDVRQANRAMKVILINFCKQGKMPCTSRFIGELYNGVDIQKRRDKHGNKRVTNFAEKRAGKALGNYLSKYVSKNDAEFEHLAWHNSRAFACMSNGVSLTEYEFTDVNEFHLSLNVDRAITSDWVTWAPWATGPPEKIKKELYELNSFIQYKQGIFHPFDKGKIKYAGFAQVRKHKPVARAAETVEKKTEPVSDKVYENFVPGFVRTDAYFLKCCDLLPVGPDRYKALQYGILQLTASDEGEAKHYSTLKFQQLAICILKNNSD